MFRRMRERARARLVRAVLAAGGADDERVWHLYDLQRAAQTRSLSTVRFLDEALANGWMVDGWRDPEVGGRRWYQLTRAGRTDLGDTEEDR